MAGDREASTSAVLTIPNLLSFARIATIPVLVWAIVHRGTEEAGLLGFAVVASTDWVDGYIARRTGTVSELGKVLDPVADRLVIVAVLVALVVRGAFPLWAAALIVVRDAALLIVGAFVLARRGVRIDVRRIGKAATAALMLGVPLIAWGALDLRLAPVATAVGWTSFAIGIVLSYSAAAWYAADLRQALATNASG
ncbi:MAG: CDP-alcohol phosphatidyltransferase family protein [Actinomycetota bacterium]